MKPKSRFIKSIVAAAKTEEVRLPWTRGANRQAAIERRHQTTSQQAAAKSA
ncbi:MULTISPECIES: hypothetical protein [Phaeobacter]|uniref:Transposase n=1 Tax=Phaeobacter inhibens TaxID=221822 RepID=A0A2I7LN06_9RHOB|nr:MULTISPECIES: hypothetical protein [Phaeobacter]AUQ46846.1 hypothetical protein PhaeoP10_02519 [Phaeobacter inhibens]AUQ49187.1 hypothetical protein PhaeoP83_00890 [Phaeobacter inhibens]AUQ55046.1 hypothetical protein PhaeoP92_02383 [Phaeobacter inhibens]AUQ59263.1 hypothetical protein PhaeoP30_02364 [Phaeobacter inhibens]AUQ63340.1 hypothetical protein PhaeoP51_02372 [Phaeobacter inhibens]